MKRLILTLIITLLIAYEGISQTSKDTTCLPNEQLRRAINRLETCKVTEEELSITKSLLGNAEKRLINRDSLILVFIRAEGNYRTLIDNYEQTLVNDKNIINKLEKTITLQNRTIRKQKWGKWAVAVLGVGVGILIAK